MLATYKLTIRTEREDLQDDLSIGFQNGVYHLSTSPLNGFHDCLDGNSFSEISQQNMIVKGGELSLMEDVKIKIVSEDIIKHMSRNDIELLGCKASMSLAVGETEKIVFSNMLISDYPQQDEISLEINLRDSAIAGAGQVNLKVPQGFGGGATLETSFGEECMLKMYKQNALGQPVSQGMRWERATNNPELEMPFDSAPLLTSNGRPAFARNFTAYEILNAGTRKNAVIVSNLSNPAESREPELAGLDGRYIEICAGHGKGNLYRIKQAQPGSGSNEILITLDRPVESDEILARSDVEMRYLKRIPAIRGYFVHPEGNLVNYYPDAGAIVQSFELDSEDEHDTKDISVFRLADTSNRYAIPRLTKDIELAQSAEIPGYRARLANADGSFSETHINFNPIEDTDRYIICEFPAGLDGKTSITRIGRHRPAWHVSKDLTSVRLPGRVPGDSEPIAITCFPVGGAPVPMGLGDFAHPLPIAVGFDTAHGSRKAGISIAFYWRVDDLPLGGKYKIRPNFSFELGLASYISLRALLVDDAGHAIASKNYNLTGGFGDGYDESYDEDNHRYSKGTKISLTYDKAYGPSGYDDERAQELLARLRSLLVFDSDEKAKYVYIQMSFSTLVGLDAGDSHYALHFAAMPIECEQEVDVKDIHIVGKDVRDAFLQSANRDIARRAKRLCMDCGISVDEQSFNDAGDKMLIINPSQNETIPFVPLKHGDKFADKLAEICRAANFSMLSDGSKLRAKYFLTSESSEQAWKIDSSHVIKGSITARSIGLDSVATEWNFSANTWDGEKTLSLETSADFPSSEWPETATLGGATLEYVGYIKDRGIPGFGARFYLYSHSGENPVKYLRVGNKYRVSIQLAHPDSNFKQAGVCELVSLRLSSVYVEALFLLDPSADLQAFDEVQNGNEIYVAPLGQEPRWREIVSGTLDIDYDSAKELWDISQRVFKKTKQRIRLDSRYAMHQVAAFGNDPSWLENFIKTAEHNSFVKNTVSLEVPIDCLPSGNLADLLLRRVVLAAERFDSNPMEGWVVGYSLNPTDDVVRIEIMNSQPIKDILWLDENILENQLTVSETEHSEGIFTEG